jgi:hypothetical protein
VGTGEPQPAMEEKAKMKTGKAPRVIGLAVASPRAQTESPRSTRVGTFRFARTSPVSAPGYAGFGGVRRMGAIFF